MGVRETIEYYDNRINDLFSECKRLSGRVKELEAQIPQWLPIEGWDDIGIVRLSSCLDNRYNNRDVIGYKHGNEYFGLNHNDCEEGSELLEWNPTHYMLLPTPPKKES